MARTVNTSQDARTHRAPASVVGRGQRAPFPVRGPVRRRAIRKPVVGALPVAGPTRQAGPQSLQRELPPVRARRRKFLD